MAIQLEREIIRLNDTLRWLGFNPANGKFNLRILLFYIFTSLLILNNAYYLYVEWDDVDQRVIALKSITNCVLLGSHSVVIVFNWDNMILSLRTIEETNFAYPYEGSAHRRHVLEENRSGMAKLNYFWYHAVFVNAAIGCIAPLLSFAKAVTRQSIRTISADQLLLILPFYYPPNHKTVAMFFVAYVIQNAFHVVGTKYAYYGVVTSFLSMKTVISELRLLRVSVDEMDAKVITTRKLPDENIDAHDLNYPLIYSTNKDTLVMKHFIRYFVKHHQDIYRKVANVNRGMHWFAFISNSGVSIYICMGIFYIVKGSDLSVKIQEITICSLWLYDVYCHDYYGEMIQTEDMNLRAALYNSSWTDRPEWFKKSVQIILARMTKTIEMRPFGLFVLCLKNFALCMNAAYSYYNLLNKVK